MIGARRACVPYTPAFQGIDLCVVRLLSTREKLAMRDAVGVLVRRGEGRRGRSRWARRERRDVELELRGLLRIPRVRMRSDVGDLSLYE
jgi:hypothetical protein